HARHLRSKRAVAACGTGPERSEIRREAFREPQMCPLPLRDRVSEPLMRGFMSDETVIRRPSAERPIGVENRARVFHAAEPGRRREMSQRFVRERTTEV